MVDRLNDFASEVTRVAREVGTEGKLGGQAVVPGVSGTWKDLTDNVNFMAANLTSQVRNIAEVTTAVANGDLSKKITVEARGEILQLKNTINGMVDRLNSFAAEVTRVAREVGTEGKLGGQASVPGVSGIWKDLTDNVNFMAANLTTQVRNIAEVTTAVANGDLSKKITADVRGEILQLKDTINTMVDQLRSFAAEVTRVAKEVGTEGKLGGQAFVPGVSGTWKDLTDSVNFMAANLTSQVRNIAAVTTAVASGDLSKKITVDVKGEMLELKNTINTMVDQLNSFASEVTRVAREVGTEGRLGGQAQVKGVSGIWKELTDNVNIMASNLTDQVRGIAKVVTAVANGNLKMKLAVAARGEIAALADTINNMIDTLATFADQVTTVAREVGVKGKLGGQANVPGAAGIWKDLTDNVNRLAANLTTQVRAIAEVATAVTKGDLSRTVKVEAQGEVEALKDNINQMIANLRETTQKNAEQDWLKTNLAKFTRMLQGQKELVSVGKLILSELAPVVNVQHGIFYLMKEDKGDPRLELLASYAFRERKNLSNVFKIGEGLVGQCAYEKERILLTNVPGDYIQISSGLGESKPLNIVVLPILFEGKVKAVIELASFERFSPIHLNFLDQLTESIGIVINTIEANARTEALLQQSQSLTKELQAQQEELQQTNEELEEKARLLSEQKLEVERKNQEVENARIALQQKAEQLALTSKYKSEFLANMSHELRTPLNSILLLAQQLAENSEGNLMENQVKFAKTIYASGNDLLTLINDILDLSKIESGTVTLEIEDIPLSNIAEDAKTTFTPIAQSKNLEFNISLSSDLPNTIKTDSKRLKQVIKNLLSNAFKFTEKGSVSFDISVAESGWDIDNEILNRADTVIAFTVSDTGIGISKEKQMIIFEAFQQADGSTSRKYGGTGLGLSISREIAKLLGGELKLIKSVVGEGSVFTLFIPQNYEKTKQAVSLLEPTTDSVIEPLMKKTDYKVDILKEPSKHEREKKSRATTETTIKDDRDNITENDKIVLIVEDDVKFANILLNTARKMGFKGIISTKGEPAVALARQLKPVAITLDIHLPDIDGWTVLDRIKLDLETRHIPIHIITVEDDRLHGLQRGAVSFLTKPVSREDINSVFNAISDFLNRPVKNLLIVEDNQLERDEISKIVGNNDVRITAVGTGTEALKLLKNEKYDCMVLDLILPDINGFEILKEIKNNPDLTSLPIIVYTAKQLTPAEEKQLKEYKTSLIIKGASSKEQLLEETALFLHRVAKNLAEPKKKIINKIYESDEILMRRKILIVDDDVRNLFALTALLERHRAHPITAQNGKEALLALSNNPDVDLILMDIMMPEMDGYETMQKIRKLPEYQKLPIIALTAKAMKGDREKCIESGATDYISKPVNPDQLLSLLRVYLYDKATK